MLRHVLFDMALFVDEADRENSQKRVLWLLEALTRCNQLYLRQNPDTPRIYDAPIEYKVPAQMEGTDVPEVSLIRDFLASRGAPSNVMAALDKLYNICGGGEIFREIPRILENGGGDCDNLAAWRTAELRELGIDAMPYITWRRRADGGMTYHVIVLWPDGSSEDPSLLLGMGYPNREADRIAEEEKLGERAADFIKGLSQTRRMSGGLQMLGVGAITTPQNFSQLQYTIPFQTDEAYADWSPTRPQSDYWNPYYPNLPTTPGGGPIFNTLLGARERGRQKALRALRALGRKRRAA